MAAPKGNKNAQRGPEKRQRVVILLPAEIVRAINYAAESARVTRTAVVESVLLEAFPPAVKINKCEEACILRAQVDDLETEVSDLKSELAEAYARTNCADN